MNEKHENTKYERKIKKVDTNVRTENDWIPRDRRMKDINMKS